MSEMSVSIIETEQFPVVKGPRKVVPDVEREAILGVFNVALNPLTRKVPKRCQIYPFKVVANAWNGLWAYTTSYKDQLFSQYKFMDFEISGLVLTCNT